MFNVKFKKNYEKPILQYLSRNPIKIKFIQGMGSIVLNVEKIIGE